MSIGSQAPTQQTVTSSTEPAAFQKPFLEQLFQRAQGLSETPAQLYPGSFTAAQSPLSTEASQGIVSAARGPVAEGVQDIAQAQSFALGDVLSPETNPQLQAYGDALSAQIGRGFQQEVLPALRQEAVGTGNTSSTRREIAAGIAGQGATDAIQRAQSGLYNQAYGQGLDTFERALALGPQSLQAQAYPSLLLDTAGQRDTALAQQGLNEQIQRFNFGQQEPTSRLAQFQNFITGNFGSNTTQDLTGAQVPRGSTASNLIGGALSGLQFAPGLSAVFPALGAAAGPAGAGIGALLAMIGR